MTITTVLLLFGYNIAAEQPIRTRYGFLNFVYRLVTFSENPFERLRTVVNISNFIVGSILTLLLGWIYFRQNTILSRQTLILEASHQPIIGSISEPEPIDEHPRSDEGGPEGIPGAEWIKLDLINTGNDVATELELHCLVAIDGEPDLDIYPSGEELIPVDKGGTVGSRRNSLDPKDQHYSFYASPVVEERTDDGTTTSPLGNLLQDLLDDSENPNVDAVKFGFAITFDSAIPRKTAENGSTKEIVYLQHGRIITNDTNLSSPSVVEAWELGDEFWIHQLKREATVPEGY